MMRGGLVSDKVSGEIRLASSQVAIEGSDPYAVPCIKSLGSFTSRGGNRSRVARDAVPRQTPAGEPMRPDAREGAPAKLVASPATDSSCRSMPRSGLNRD